MAYERVPSEQLILRDVLARDRTVLANERTLLAYVRTALMIGVTAVTLYKLMSDEGWWVPVVAVGLGLLALLTLSVGVGRFLRVRRSLHAIASDLGLVVSDEAPDSVAPGSGK